MSIKNTFLEVYFNKKTCHVNLLYLFILFITHTQSLLQVTPNSKMWFLLLMDKIKNKNNIQTITTSNLLYFNCHFTNNEV